MPVPAQQFTVNEFGTGVVQPATSIPTFLGYSSGGTENVLKTYNRLPDLVAGEGQGPAVEDAAFVLSNVGGPVRFMKTTCSIAGALSAVVESGTSGPDVTVSGTPNDDYQAKIEIVAAGALGVGKFKYTLDNGETYSEHITIPSGGTYAIPSTGITATFVSGTHLVGTIHTFTATAPMWNATNLATAFAALSVPPYGLIDWDFVTASGKHATAAAGATQFAGLQTQLAALASTYFRHKGGICDVGDDSAANIITSFGAQTGVRVLPAFGGFVAPSAKPIPGWSMPLRRTAGGFAYLAARSLISTDLKRVRSGPIPGCKSITHDGFLQDAGLDGIKISTLRTWPNKVGFFATQGHLKSQMGSDFRYWPHRRVMDAACNFVYGKQTEFIGEGLTTLLDGSGTLDPGDAADLMSEVNEGLRVLLMQPTNARGKKGHVTGVSYTVDTTNNVLQTGLLLSQVAITSLAYVDNIATTFSFVTAQPVQQAA
jgi:hypothetical protein